MTKGSVCNAEDDITKGNVGIVTGEIPPNRWWKKMMKVKRKIQFSVFFPSSLTLPLHQVSERKRTAGYSDLSMKTSWRGFAENTWVVESTCTWLRSLFSRRVVHCVDSCFISQTHLSALLSHTHLRTHTTFWWRPLDGAQTHHHLHHVALSAPAAAAAHSACWELGPRHPGDKPSLGSHPLIWCHPPSPHGLLCECVCVSL